MRIAKAAGEVDVLNYDYAVRLASLQHCIKALLRVTQVCQQKARVNQIELSFSLTDKGIGVAKLDVIQTFCRSVVLGQRQNLAIGISANHLTGCSD
jgi:hypothetical protein